ncbi:MAG: DNA-binding response regulator, partial [Bacteroidetes bacterium 4572_112]
MIKILIADDHKLFVDGLISLLTMEHNISIVAKAYSGKEMLDCLSKYDIDVVLSDINMPGIDGVEAAKVAMKKYPKLKIIMLSMHKGSMIIRQVIKMGVHGYILKNTDNAEL